MSPAVKHLHSKLFTYAVLYIASRASRASTMYRRLASTIVSRNHHKRRRRIVSPTAIPPLSRSTRHRALASMSMLDAINRHQHQQQPPTTASHHQSLTLPSLPPSNSISIPSPIDVMQTSLFVPDTYIKLPPPPFDSSGSHRSTKFAYQEVEERLACISVLLHRDPTKAEAIFLLMMYSSKTRDVLKLKLTPAIQNAFLEAFIDRNLTERAHEWSKIILERQYGIGPDCSTYAILLSWHLAQGMVDHAIATVQTAETEGISTDALRRNFRFTDTSRRNALEALLRQMGKNVDGYSQADSLLLSALQSAGYEREDADNILTDYEAIDKAYEELETASQALQGSNSIDAIEVESTASADGAHTSGLLWLRSVLRKVPTVGASPIGLSEAQVLLETATVEAAVQELEALAADRPSTFALSTQSATLIWQWTTELASAIESELAAIKSDPTASQKFCTELSFVSLINPKAAALVAISCAIEPMTKMKRNHEAVVKTDHGMKFTALCLVIGKACEREYNLMQAARSSTRRWLKAEMKISALDAAGRSYEIQTRRIRKHLEAFEARRLEHDWIPVWPDNVKLKVGAFLAGLLLNTVKVAVVEEGASKDGPPNPPTLVPAFEHFVGIKNSSRVVGYFRASEAMRKMKTPPILAPPTLLPMLVSPKPWAGSWLGGYLTIRQPLIRIFNNPEHRDYIRAAEKADNDGGHLKFLMKGLDVLGQCPWRINEKILSTVVEAWKDDNPIGGLPAIKLSRPKPEMPSDEVVQKDPRALKRYRAQLKTWQNDASGLFSQRCSEAYKIEIAKAYAGHILYFPHNIDFRGRAYPLPSHLNHMGSDMCRGVMEFAEAKPLGKRGLDWLKIQVASLAGVTKVSFADRIKFTEANISEVFDSADEPLAGRRWWTKGDAPFQLLATCVDLAAALRYPNPEEYPSRLPVHQDGTCNGLQHYAALGGDIHGAEKVNLVPSDKPQDLYSGVASIVARFVEEHAKAYGKHQEIIARGEESDITVKLGGEDVPPPPESIIIHGKITRALVKQTVMTDPYGVTFIGAREQVAARLIETQDENQLTHEQIRSVSIYVAKLILASLGELFTCAKSIQKWFNVAALLVCRSIPENRLTSGELENARILGEIGALSEYEAGLVDDFKPRINPNKEQSVVSLVVPDIASLGLLDDESEGEQNLTEPEEESASVWIDVLVRKKSECRSKSKDTDPRMIKNVSMIWTTPMGVPIVQPYREAVAKVIHTPIQYIISRELDYLSEVSPRKQSSAFPPNFVHSLDACHMMLTAIASEAANIRFAAVHDSFWTHAADSDKLASILRQTFVKLHSIDVLQRLASELQDRISRNRLWVKVPLTPSQAEEWHKRKGKPKNKIRSSVSAWARVELPPLPKQGDLDVRQVLDSPYFFH
ncbi:DNA-directed RNA polymerase [Synchytrium endobioticum]|uniref:DNA-directed RNA polymerase n=1 Tax=Synchytrium endobioticum TaxID=286115 RepID=A0A507DI06_9FUNG|nr:DNA-directed RNA polymerase [Synchytrium endobioticum]